MAKISIVQQIHDCCKANRYDEAFTLTNDIPEKEFAIRAHLLVMEHEHRRYLDNLADKRAGIEDTTNG